MKAKSLLICMMLAMLTACSDDEIPQIEPISPISKQTFFEKTSDKTYSLLYGTYLLHKNNTWEETPAHKIGLNETASMRPDIICNYAIPSNLYVKDGKLYADNIQKIDFYDISSAEYAVIKDYYIYYNTVLNIDPENHFLMSSTYFATTRAKGYNFVIENVSERDFTLRLEIPKNRIEVKFDAVRLKYQIRDDTQDEKFFFDSQEEAAEYVRTLINENDTEARDADDRPYYWADGKKEYLSYVDNSSFVLFYKKDRGSIFNSLSELGVDCSTILEGDYSEKTNLIIEKGSAYDYPDGCLWMRVDIPCQTLKDKLTDTIYISPLMTDFYGGTEFAISNKIMVSYEGSMASLKEIIKDYNVEIMGRLDINGSVFLLWCSNDSEWNALEIANKIHKSGKVGWAAPCFHGLGRYLIG